VTGIEDRINKLREERNNCRSPDRNREIMQEISILEEDKKVFKDSIRTEIFLAHPDNLVALQRVFPTGDKIYRYEAITKLLADGKRTTIYITSTWVKQHCEAEYVQRLNKFLDSNEFVNILNVRANPTKKVQNAVLDFQCNLHTQYVCTNPLGYLCINKRRSMPTMYILRLNMFVTLLVQKQQFTLKPSGVLNQLKKIHISRRKKHLRLFLQMILIWSMTTFLAMTILKKDGPNPNIPGFLLMKLC
jgi:hypothetical protein